MSISKLTDDLNIISSLEDQPSLTASELKAKFDEGSKIIQEYINNNLSEEIDDISSELTSQLSSVVTGVKGNAESSYRTGNVNLTPANIGAMPLSGGTLTGTTTTRSIIPSADSTYNIGSSSKYYNIIYANYVNFGGTNHAIKLQWENDSDLVVYVDSTKVGSINFEGDTTIETTTTTSLSSSFYTTSYSFTDLSGNESFSYSFDREYAISVPSGYSGAIPSVGILQGGYCEGEDDWVLSAIYMNGILYVRGYVEASAQPAERANCNFYITWYK